MCVQILHIVPLCEYVFMGIAYDAVLGGGGGGGVIHCKQAKVYINTNVIH